MSLMVGRSIGLALTLLTTAFTSAAAEELAVVRPKEIDEVLINPGIGFTTFQRFNGDHLNEGLKWTEGFPIEYALPTIRNEIGQGSSRPALVVRLSCRWRS